MKTTLIWSVCLTTMCSFLGASHVHAQGQPGAGTSVAVIDINFIFKNHQRFKASMDDIKKDIEEFEAHLRDQRTQITSKTEQLKNLPAESQEYRQLEEHIADVHTSLQLETGRKRKEILEREAKVYYNAYKEIEAHVSSFADRYGIGLVLRFSSEEMDPTKRDSVLAGVNRAIVFQRGLNITKPILDELNRGTPPPLQSGRPQIPARQPTRNR